MLYIHVTMVKYAFNIIIHHIDAVTKPSRTLTIYVLSCNSKTIHLYCFNIYVNYSHSRPIHFKM